MDWQQLGTMSSNGNISRVTGPLRGEFTGHRWIPRTKASDAELWCFCFFLRLNKRLSKQWWGWWFETPSRPLWRYCNEHPIFFLNIEYFWYNFWSTRNVNPSYSSTDVNDSYKMFEAWPPLPPFYKISRIFACTLYDSNNDVHVTIQTYS